MGDELTNVETYQDYLISIAQLIGATIAIVFTQINIDINILMLIQIIASVIMGYFDFKTIKIIKIHQSNA